MTKQLLVDLDGSLESHRQPATGTPSDKARPPHSPETNPPSHQLSASDGAPAKKSKVTLAILSPVTSNTSCLFGINSKEERATNSQGSRNGESNSTADSCR